MKITLNGQTHDFTGNESLDTLTKRFCKDPLHVIAELNGKIIDHASWGKTFIRENDKIELVTFVGGG